MFQHGRKHARHWTGGELFTQPRWSRCLSCPSSSQRLLIRWTIATPLSPASPSLTFKNDDAFRAQLPGCPHTPAGYQYNTAFISRSSSWPYEALDNLVPSCLTDLCLLTSSDACDLLTPLTRTKHRTLGDRAFATATSTHWNSLPPKIHWPDSTPLKL